MMSFKEMDFRKKWDKTFESDCLKKTEDGGVIIYTKLKVSFPLKDRYLTVYEGPIREVGTLIKKS